MKLTFYWLDTSGPFTGAVTGLVQGSCDVAVIRGGLTGCSAALTPLIWTIMADVMDGRTELNPWKDFAWPAIPGHLGPPWFLPLVGAYYRIKDRFQ
jgi:hypothetical protein